MGCLDQSEHKPVDHESVLALLGVHLDQLPPTLQKVVELLLQEGYNLPDFSIKELAEKAQVSPAAVVRMCQAIGFDGFRDFRLRWVREAGIHAVGASIAHSKVPPSIDNVITQTRELLRAESLQQAAALVINSRQLFMYGGGSSGLVGSLVSKVYSRVGYLTLVFDDNDLKAAALDLTDDQTVIIVFSHRGRNPVIERRVQQDKRRGARCIVITSNPASPLAKLADVVLLAGGQGAHANGILQLPARITQLICAQALLEMVTRKRGNELVRKEAAEAEVDLLQDAVAMQLQHP